MTDQRVRLATAPKGQRIELWDAVLPGLGLRIAEGGSKTWFVRYRTAKTQRRMRIGTYPTLLLADAREAARGIFTEIGKGTDPAASRRAAEAAADADTFQRIAQEFVTRYAKRRNRSWRETERILERYVLPEWSRRPISEISRRDILDLLDGMVDRGVPVMAKQTLSTVRKLFNWALDRGVIETSPCVRVPIPGKAKDRERVLDDNELRAVWLACDPLRWPFRPGGAAADPDRAAEG